MIRISHRGNINGKFPHFENHPDYIDEAIRLGFNVEIDIWLTNGKFFLGHDKPQYDVDMNWINDRFNKLWIHCKNTESISFLNRFNYDLNYFWHQEDMVTLTSKNFIWVYPGNQPIKNSIAVLPEIYNDNLSECIGVCSDFIKKYE